MQTTYRVDTYNRDNGWLSEDSFDTSEDALKFLARQTEEDDAFYPDGAFSYKLTEIKYEPVERELAFEIETRRVAVLV